MLDPKESRFWQSTILSGLMDAEGLTACWNAIPPGKRDDPQHIDRRLARQAVQARALSLWQAQQIIAGRTSGFKVDRYVLLDLIGQGGMGRVYLALDSRLNREVALKILSPERVNNPRAIARFQREARVGAQLQHENLVRIYDFGESNGRYYLVMEYIEGKTIGTLISERGAISPSTAVRLIRQVSLGLEHAFRKGLVHRDVNPYNILVTRDGTAKLADLGLAIDLAEDDRVTREGATVGTFDYVAPEQARHSHSADIRSDIYSLGCSLYHMCSGQVPFPTPSLPEKLFAHQAMEPAPLAQLITDLAPGLSEVVQRMMSKSPEDRYATPLQVAQALEPYEEENTLATERATEQQATPETPVVAPSAAVASVVPINGGGVANTAGIAVVKSAGPKTVADAAVNHTATAKLRVPSTVRSPGSAQGSDPEFPLDLILAPEPSLTEGLSRPKSRSGLTNPGTSFEGILRLRLSRKWLWVLFFITAGVLFLAAMLAVFNPFAETARTQKKPGPVNSLPDDKEEIATNPSDAKVKSTVSEPALSASTAPIVVRSDAESPQPFAADKLFDAIETALGGSGWVELRNREPLKLVSGANALLDFGTARGTINIRAAEGIEPVIDVELNGTKPLMVLGSGVTLRLSGVSIVVHYPAPREPSSPAPPPLIKTAYTAKLDRCAFKVAPGPHPKGCHVVQSDIGLLDVDRCWFEGFDNVIELYSAELKTMVRITNTMIVRAAAGALPNGPPAEDYGWGVKLQFKASPRPQGKSFPPNFLVDRCTFEGAGLFDLNDSPGPAPVQVELRRCFLNSNTLLAVNPKGTPKNQIQWRGESNYFDVTGRSWIVNSASQGTPVLSAAATDLDGWVQFVQSEKDPIRTKLKYRVDLSARGEPLRPQDFAIDGPEPSQGRPGAEPNLVGPSSRP